jgi:hypothetical protein
MRVCRSQQGFAHPNAHGAAHELEIEGSHDGIDSAYLAVGNEQGVLLSRLALAFLEPVAVTLAVAKPQRIERYGRCLHLVVLAPIEQQFEPLTDRNTQVMAAVRADPKVFLQFPVKDHLAAFRAFLPEIVGNIGLVDQRPDLGADEIGNPVHILSPLSA